MTENPTAQDPAERFKKARETFWFNVGLNVLGMPLLGFDYIKAYDEEKNYPANKLQYEQANNARVDQALKNMTDWSQQKIVLSYDARTGTLSKLDNRRASLINRDQVQAVLTYENDAFSPIPLKDLKSEIESHRVAELSSGEFQKLKNWDNGVANAFAVISAGLFIFCLYKTGQFYKQYRQAKAALPGRPTSGADTSNEPV